MTDTDYNERFTRLDAALQAMSERNGSMDRKLAVMDEQLGEVRAEVSKMRQTLHYGNGQEPLVGRVANLERGIRKLDDANAESVKGRVTIMATAITALGGLVLGLLSLWQRKSGL